MTSIFQEAYQPNQIQTQQPEDTDLGYKDMPENKDSIFQDAARENKPLPKVEGTGEKYLRHGVRTVARGIEFAAGLPGMARDIVKSGYEKITGKPVEEPKRRGLFEIRDIIKSPEELRELNKQITQGYSEPKTKGEARWDEFVQDTTALLIPGGRAVRALGIAGIGQAAKQVVKTFGGSEKAQDYTRMGAQIIASLYNPGGATRHIGNLYNQAEQALPQGARVNATQLERNMNNLRHRMTRGTGAPSERAIEQEAEAILNKIQNGEITVEEAVAAKRSINEKAQSFLYSTPDRAATARARRFYNQINRDLDRTIAQAETSYPEFYRDYRRAQEAFGSFAESRRISDWIGRHAKLASTGAGGTLAGILFKVGLPAAIKTAGAGAASAALLKSGELMYRIGRSPELRRYYLNAMQAAAQENALSFNNYINKLSKEIEKDPELMKIYRDQLKNQRQKG